MRNNSRVDLVHRCRLYTEEVEVKGGRVKVAGEERKKRGEHVSAYDRDLG